MTIAEMRERCNAALARVPFDALIIAVVILASSGAFGLGYLVGKGGGGEAGKDGFWTEELATTSAALPAAAAAAVSNASLSDVPVAAAAPLPVNREGAAVTPTAGKYVASKNGTKYYLPSCSGAKRIKPENTVWFASAADAQAAGLTPAANCPGL